jgi:hypothetical protein
VSQETVSEVAALYLGNILYALELAALSLESEGKQDEAAFYRGIAKKLAEARGREQGPGNRDQGPRTREQGPGTRDQG